MPRSNPPDARSLTPDQRLRQVLGDDPHTKPRRAMETQAPSDRQAIRMPSDAPPQSLQSVSDEPIAAEQEDIKDRVKQFASRHLAAVGMVLVIMVTFAVFQTTRAHSETVEIQLESSANSSSPLTSPSASTTPQLMRVHVAGAVYRPGVVSLAVGSRVVDAIEAAGGLVSDADLGELNLAAIVSDGSQILVGKAGGATSGIRSDGQSSAAQISVGQEPNMGGATKLNLNTANQTQLETLPGVGPVTAKAILGWRSEHGKFTRIEELQEVNGIGAKTYAQIAPHVTVGVG